VSPAAPAPAAAKARFDGRWVLLALAAVGCLTAWVGPPIALTAGLVLALTGLTPGPIPKAWSKYLIQASVVLLGFTMSIMEVARHGAGGLAFAAGTILGTFILAALLTRLLKTEPIVSTLIASGTAICGGSAIAATGAAVRANQTQMAVALGTVFLLNAAALYAFPPLGHALGMTPAQFGTWAAVAIHDVSSVVGAAAAFDPLSPEVAKTAITIKLARVLWIVPVTLVAAWWFGRSRSEGDGGKTGKFVSPVPVFVILFVLAATVRQFVPRLEDWSDELRLVARKGMTLALLLIGASLSRRALAAVGWRPMVLGVALWLAISAASLAVIRGTM
jgi:uncharacterized integral membrane protein (TIGR00698 family)